MPGIATRSPPTHGGGTSVPARRSARASTSSSTSNGSLAELLARLRTSPEGLSAAEAQRRLDEDGPNQLGTTSLRARIVAVVRAALNPLVMILLVACIASGFLGQIADAVIIASMVVLSAGINFWQTFRSERAVKRLQAQVAPTATVRRDRRWIEIPRRELVTGDVVRLSAGDLVPADVRLIEAADLHVQQAALTGESLPVEKAASPGVLASTGPEAPELLFLGTSIVSGTASAVVLATGQATAFGDIVARLASRPDETEFDRGMHKFGMLILETVIFLVLFILVINVALGRNALESVLFSVALAVGLTPEFLPMITTVTLAQGAVRMAREKVREGDREAPLGDPEPRQHRHLVQRQDRHAHRRHDVARRRARPARPARRPGADPRAPEQHLRSPGSRARSMPRSSSAICRPTAIARPTRSRSTSSAVGCRSSSRTTGASCS